MNKHQEAWDYVKGMQNDKYGDYSKEKQIIQELVDKATPTKPTGISLGHDNGRVGNCPSCRRLVCDLTEDIFGKPLHICSCGQKLSWDRK